MSDVFILGTAYSGSTLLGNCLSTHSKINYLGEINHIINSAPRFKTSKDIEICIYCYMHNKVCPVWTEATVELFKKCNPKDLFNIARNLFKKEIIIDGSKHVFWFNHLRSIGYDTSKTKVLISVKNPFATVNSIVKKGVFPNWQAANIWRDTYVDIFRTLNSSDIPYYVVKYEDFSADLEKKLNRICSFLDIKFEKKMLDFYHQETHSLNGNIRASGGTIDTDTLKKQGGFSDPSYLSQHGQEFKQEKAWLNQMKKVDLDITLKTPLLPDLAHFLGYNIQELTEEFLSSSKNNQEEK